MLCAFVNIGSAYLVLFYIGYCRVCFQRALGMGNHAGY